MHSMTKEQERIEKVRAEEVLACTAVVGVSHEAHATQARARLEVLTNDALHPEEEQSPVAQPGGASEAEDRDAHPYLVFDCVSKCS